MAISIKNNFLKRQDFLNIKNFIMGNSMPWFFGNDISHETKNNKYIKAFFGNICFAYLGIYTIDLLESACTEILRTLKSSSDALD